MELRFTRSLSFLAASVVCYPVIGGVLRAQVPGPDAVVAEIERGERRIREVRVEIGNRYEKKLAELRLAYQKLADLENAVAVRAEETRMAAETQKPLEGGNLVAEPRLLREAQTELLTKQGEMLTQVLQESLPKLLEMRKTLTMAGKLDDALKVSGFIRSMQDAASPAQHLPPNSTVTAEEVFQAFQTSRERGEAIYKGSRLLLRGKVAGVRPDPREPGAALLVLFGGAESAFVDCAFPSADYKVREERAGQNVVYVVSRSSDAAMLKVQRGAVVEIQGKYEGVEGAVRFGGCSLPKR